ncbi:MAG: hypothetical protein V4812_15830 [Pseudomonadota bacterium]
MKTLGSIDSLSPRLSAAVLTHQVLADMAAANGLYETPCLAGGIPGQPGPDTPAEPGMPPEQPSEPGSPTLPDQPPPAPVV